MTMDVSELQQSTCKMPEDIGDLDNKPLTLELTNTGSDLMEVKVEETSPDARSSMDGLTDPTDSSVLPGENNCYQTAVQTDIDRHCSLTQTNAHTICQTVTETNCQSLTQPHIDTSCQPLTQQHIDTNCQPLTQQHIDTNCQPLSQPPDFNPANQTHIEGSPSGGQTTTLQSSMSSDTLSLRSEVPHLQSTTPPDTQTTVQLDIQAGLQTDRQTNIHQANIHTIVQQQTGLQPLSNTVMLIECAACHLAIKDRYLLKTMDMYWHEDCLKCSCCDCRLGEVGSSLYTKANLLLCKRDYLRLFGASGLCTICKKTIPAFEMVMKVKNNVYHLECFACQQCRQRFCVGDKFYLCENRILCEYDFEEQNLITSIQRGYNALSHMRRQAETLSDISSGYGSPSPGTL